MAGTLSIKKPSPPAAGAGRPNMYLSVVRQSALQLAERSWKNLDKPQAETTAMEFAPPLEWDHICGLHYEVSGFDFTGVGPKEKAGRAVSDGKIVDVAALLAEVDRPRRAEAGTPAPIHWDELDVAAAPPPNDDVAVLHAALELYEPPEEPKPARGKTVQTPPPVVEVKAAEAILEAVEEEPAYRPPEMAGPLDYTKPEMKTPPAAAAAAQPDPLAAPGPRLHMPAVTVLPLRQTMVAGPAPEASAAPVKSVAEAVVEPAVEKTEAVRAAAAPAEAKAEIKVEAKAAAPQGKKKRKHQKGSHRGPVEEAIEEPEDLGEELEAEIAAGQKPAEEPVRTLEPAAVVEQAKKQAPEPKLSFGGMADVPVEAPKSASLSLGLNSEETPLPASAGMSTGLKAGIAVAVLGVVGTVAVFTMGGDSKNAPAGKAAAVSVLETAGVVAGDAGWSTDYTTDAKGKRVRQMSFYRPSMQISDYRVEFQAEIEYKAVGWAVRASNTKTYWALKLFQEGGRVKLRRFTVTDGKDGAPTDVALPFASNAGMVFRVRTDVVGGRFVVTVNEQKVDEWHDAQIAMGGFAVANEGAERGQIRSIQLWHLRERQVTR
jgi:hypothetical protein